MDIKININIYFLHCTRWLTKWKSWMILEEDIRNEYNGSNLKEVWKSFLGDKNFVPIKEKGRKFVPCFEIKKNWSFIYKLFLWSKSDNCYIKLLNNNRWSLYTFLNTSWLCINSCSYIIRQKLTKKKSKKKKLLIRLL